MRLSPTHIVDSTPAEIIHCKTFVDISPKNAITRD